MKTKILIALVAITIVSCKTENKEQDAENKEVNEEVVNPNFNVELTATAAKKDDFALYFTEDNTINFTAENALWCGIEPLKENATVYFEIPEERLPSHIRLDFGLNKAQDSVVLKNVEFNYLKNTFEIKGSEFFKYFNQDEQFKTKIDDVNGTVTFYKSGSEYKTPYYYPNDSLVKKIIALETK